MAVEYEISSDVATIKDVAPNTQVARVVSLYSGQITYDDEAGSKFATATIDGKSQRVMLCIAVNGTVNYDDVPCLYSTVDGHRCLNIVAPTETGTPDDVPSVNETVVIDGMNVRAVRCILINATPVYDGVSSVCTFTGDDGKTHTAQLVNKITGGSVEVIVKGISPITLPDAIADSLEYLKAFGGTEQRNIPQPYTQVNYVTNTAQTAVDTGIMIDFAKNYEFEVECRAVSGSWYILQSRASASGNVTGIHGETSGSTIKLVVGNVTVCTSAITRTVGNKLYVKATLNAGTATLYVKDETANTEDTQTGSYGTSQPNPTAAVYLLGNAGGQYADVNSDIYMARIKENGVTVMDYVPARQVATAGFYDKASGTFKTALTPANLSADGNTVPTPDAPMDIVSNNGVLKANTNLYWTEYNNYQLAQADGVTVSANSGVNVSGFVDCRTIKSFKITTASPQGSFRIFKYRADNTFIDANSTANIGDIITVGDNVGFFRMQYNYTNAGVGTWNILIYNSAYPYGIYTDGTVETINVHGKNLYNVSADTVGYSINEEGNIVPADTSAYSSAIPVQTGQYTYSGICSNQGGTNNKRIHGYLNGVWVQQIDLVRIPAGEEFNYTFMVPNGINEIRISHWSEDTNTQVEQGSTATAYAPYYDGGTATAEMLLKVGDYEDVQSIIDGVVTRNVGVKVLDGTESWKDSTNYCWNLNASEFMGSPMPVFCSHFEYSTTSPAGTARWGKVFASQYGLAFGARASSESQVSDTVFLNVSDWKQWLANQYNAGTPVIIVYQLATPTTESVAGQTLQVTDGDNVVEITQASLDNLELEAKYQAAVTLTIQEVQDANLDPNVQVTIN